MSKELIFDFETLGQNTIKCPIIDCAYYIFDMDRFTGKNPYTFEELVSEIKHDKVDVKDQIENFGFIIEKGTVDWWTSQGKEAQKKIVPKSTDIPLNEFFDNMMGYVEDHGKIDRFWSRSNTFDPVILWRISASLNQQKRHDNNLQFWKVRDTRTYIDALGFFGINNSFTPEDDEAAWKKKFEKHNAIHDVAADILRMQKLTRMHRVEE